MVHEINRIDEENGEDGAAGKGKVWGGTSGGSSRVENTESTGEQLTSFLPSIHKCTLWATSLDSLLFRSYVLSARKCRGPSLHARLFDHFGKEGFLKPRMVRHMLLCIETNVVADTMM